MSMPLEKPGPPFECKRSGGMADSNMGGSHPGLFLRAPSELFCHTLYLANEYIVASTPCPDLIFITSGPSVVLFNRAIPAGKRASVFQAILFCRCIGEHDAEFIICPWLATVRFIPALFDLPFSNSFSEDAS